MSLKQRNANYSCDKYREEVGGGGLGCPKVPGRVTDVFLPCEVMAASGEQAQLFPDGN